MEFTIFFSRTWHHVQTESCFKVGVPRGTALLLLHATLRTLLSARAPRCIVGAALGHMPVRPPFQHFGPALRRRASPQGGEQGGLGCLFGRAVVLLLGRAQWG